MISLHRRAATLLELLTVVAIVGLLISLLLPAVAAARSAVRQAHCQSNLSQVGKAVQQYLDVHNLLPMGRMFIADPRYSGGNPPCTSRFTDRSPLISLLPFCAEGYRYETLNLELSVFGSENATSRRSSSSLYVCPADPNAGVAYPLPALALSQLPVLPTPSDSWVHWQSTVAFNFGSLADRAFPFYYANCQVPDEVRNQQDGAFVDLRGVKAAEITDGFAKTMLASELRAWSPEMLAKRATADVSSTRWWIEGNLGDTLFCAGYRINDPTVESAADRDSAIYGASSHHSGGVNVVMLDGSVQFIGEAIDSWPFDATTGGPGGASLGSQGYWLNVPKRGVWQSMAARADGQ